LATAGGGGGPPLTGAGVVAGRGLLWKMVGLILALLSGVG
jgi:hypothetical protein